MEACTFVGNHATEGGGLLGCSDRRDFIVLNSTFSENDADSGGAISNADGNLYVRSSTLVGNTARIAPALITHSYATRTPRARTFLSHDILAHADSTGTGALCKDELVIETAGVTAGIVSNQFNLRGDASCGAATATDLLVSDPMLGPLADNGGLTLTRLPFASSPAVNAGSFSASDTATSTDCALVDQRGISRPQGAPLRCDIGAVELAPTP